MLNLDLTAVLFLLSGTAAGTAVVYYSFVLAREWFDNGLLPVKASSERRTCRKRLLMYTLPPNGLKAVSGWTLF